MSRPEAAWRLRRFKVNPFAAKGPGDHLHGACLLSAPSADSDFLHAGPPGRKKSGVPVEKPLGGQGLIVFLGGVEHQFDHPVNVPFGRSKGADVHPKSPGDRRADLVTVEDLALNLTRFDDFLGQRLKGRFRLQLEAKAFHPAQKPTLLVARPGREFPRAFRRTPLGTRATPVFHEYKPWLFHPLTGVWG